MGSIPREENKAEPQTSDNLIGIYFDSCWSVQVPSCVILSSAGRLQSIIASLWKPVKFIMKEGSGSGGAGAALLFWHPSGKNPAGGIVFLIFINSH